jgi:hypothetical protein
MNGETPVPITVVTQVEGYVESELRDSEKFSNRAPLDESGVWNLHRLMANVYAAGFDAGVRVQAERSRASDRRRREVKEAVL